MPRTKTGIIRHRRHKKILEANKGFRGANSRLYKRAHEAYLHSGVYAYVGRKLRKRDFRSLWIVRINAALKQINPELQYSRFMNAMKKANVTINRKMLSEIAIADFNTFKEIVQKVTG